MAYKTLTLEWKFLDVLWILSFYSGLFFKKIIFISRDQRSDLQLKNTKHLSPPSLCAFYFDTISPNTVPIKSPSPSHFPVHNLLGKMERKPPPPLNKCYIRITHSQHIHFLLENFSCIHYRWPLPSKGMGYNCKKLRAKIFQASFLSLIDNFLHFF